MLALGWIGMVVGLLAGQGAQAPAVATPPAYVREGDRVEQEFRTYRNKLDQFFQTLRGTVERDIPALLPELQEAPPQPVVYGYQLLPRIVDNGPLDRKPVASFSYSWPITRGYIAGEGVKLERAQATMQQATQATGLAKSTLILSLIHEYKTLVDDQRIIDQYIQYNRLWQRAIAEDRARFDEMTRLYNMMTIADADTAGAIRQLLGHPLVPSSIQVVTTAATDNEKQHMILRVPVTTDIENDTFLVLARSYIQSVWKAEDDKTSYAVEVEFRKIAPELLYPNQTAPKRGNHIDPRVHAARFPSDAVVLTTGAEITHAVVKRYIALGPGDMAVRTFAHEFGHLLGFPDGYIRGYKNLGETGFEIQELTSVFTDIMSAPREGSVQATHFKLIIEALKQSNRKEDNP